MADREMQILHLMGYKWPRGNLIPSHLILCPGFFFLVTENTLSLASSENLRRRKRKGFRKEGALGNGCPKAVQSIVCREQILPRLVYLQG